MVLLGFIGVFAKNIDWVTTGIAALGQATLIIIGAIIGSSGKSSGN